ncbi:MAG: hypothetical protein Q8P90_04175 [bacterium]|nr:hypothetical protein [bacterium]
MSRKESEKQVRALDSSEFNKLGTLDDKIEFVLNYAVLAPSTHNSQPWLFRVQDNKCYLEYNEDINIVYGDPQKRDLFISLGCCLENIIVAAKHFGIYSSYKYVKEGGNTVAEVAFIDSEDNIKKDPHGLFNAIKNRFNSRSIYKDKNVPLSFLEEAVQLNNTAGMQIKFIRDKTKINDISQLTADAVKEAYRDPLFRKEMSQWINSNFTSKRAGMPGYSLGVNTPLSVVLPYIIRSVNIGNKIGKLCSDVISSAPYLCVITSDTNSKEDWLNSGRLAERLMLFFNKNGLNTSIYVASLEIGDVHKKVKNVIGGEKIPHFIFAVGYADSVDSFSPRHPVKSKLVTV